MSKHPITPPPELIRKWNEEAATAPMADQRYTATQASRWGADQELHALLTWLRAHHYDNLASDLLAARRPKPPSLKEQALTQLDSLHADLRAHGLGTNTGIIRRALKRLQELEEGSD